MQFEVGGTPRRLVGSLEDARRIDSSRIEPRSLAPWLLQFCPLSRNETPFEALRVQFYEDTLSYPYDVVCTNPDEARALVLSAIEASVDRTLVGVRRVAVMTGGGLDSSLLMALAHRWARRTGGSAFAIALDFEGPGDDRPHLRELESYLGCEVVRVQPEDAARQFAHVLRGVGGVPFGFPTAVAEVELLVRAREHGAEKALSGGGGDEIFGGVPAALTHLAWRGHIVTALRRIRRLQGFARPPRPLWSWLVRPMLGDVMPQPIRRRWFAGRGAREQRWVPPWAGPVLREFIEHSRHALALCAAKRPRTARARFEQLASDPERPRHAWAMHLLERASGLRVASPYMDPQVLAAVASLSPELLLDGDRWRGLFRESARGWIPEGVRMRSDKASFVPSLRRLVAAAGAASHFAEAARGERLAHYRLVERAPFREAAERFVASWPDEEWLTVWPALATECFLLEANL